MFGGYEQKSLKAGGTGLSARIPGDSGAFFLLGFARSWACRCRGFTGSALSMNTQQGSNWDESGANRNESAGDHGTGGSRSVGLETPRRPWARPRATPEGLLGPGRGTADRDEKEVPVKPCSKKSSVVRCSRAAIEG